MQSRRAPASRSVAVTLACAALLGGCCTQDSDCTDTGGQFCIVGTCESLVCVYDTPRDCSDGVSCTADSCDEDEDRCVQEPEDEVCDDGLYCTGAETCDPTLDCQPGAPVDCDDSISCTVDSCDEAAEACRHVPSDLLCDDAIDCTHDLCEATGCQNEPDDLLCDDESVCTGVETCDPGAGCLAGTPLECDDGLFCTGVETCDPALGCQPGAPVDCDDGVECTADTCDDAAGSCVHAADDGPCDDGLWCDGAETCDPGLGCVGGTAPACLDDDPCTADLCDEAARACSFPPDDGVPCDFEGGGPGSGTCFDSVCLARGCGDGSVEPGPAPPAEECDPGPAGETSGCTSECRSRDFHVSELLPEPYRNGDQELAEGDHAVAALSDGRFVAVWSTATSGCGAPDWPDVCLSEVHAAIVTASGEPDGDVVHVNPETAGSQLRPAVAAMDEGFLVVWSDDGIAGRDRVLWARGFDADGLPLSRGSRVSTTSMTAAPDPSIAAVPGGGFAVVWDNIVGTDTVARMRWLDADGRPTGSTDTPVSAAGLRVELSPAAAASTDGTTLLVAWSSATSLMADRSISAALFSTATGLPLLRTDLAVSTVPPGEDDIQPTIAALPSGGFFVVYRRAQTGDTRLLGRTISSTGVLGPQAVLTPSEEDWTYLDASVSAFPDDTVALAWTDSRTPSADAISDAVLGALVDPFGLTGEPELLTDPTQLNTTTRWSQTTPQLATSGEALALCFTDWSLEGLDTDGAQVRCRVLGGGWLLP